MKKKKQPISATISFYYMGNKVDSMEAFIELEKLNPKISKQDLFDAFTLFLDKSHFEPELQKFVPHLSKKRLLEIVDFTPAIGLRDIFRKYGDRPKLLKLATSFFHKDVVRAIAKEFNVVSPR